MRVAAPVAVAAALLLGAGGAGSQPAPAPALLSMAELMRHVVNPAAEAFWKRSGEVDSEAGAESRAPTTDAAWTELANAAAVVGESGRLLAITERVRDGAWARYAQDLTAAGAAGLQAARAKDASAAFEAGSAMYDACYGCHGQYIPRPANSLYKQRLPDDAFLPPGEQPAAKAPGK